MEGKRKGKRPLRRMNNSLGPRVEKTMSVISTVPRSPDSPTLKTGWGLLMSENASPAPKSVVQTSPTMRVFGGMVTVDVMRYVPASKNMILHPANLK